MRYITCILISILTSGCVIIGTKMFSRKNQTIRFTNSYNPKIEDRININGYYYNVRPYLVDLFALYPDGTFLGFSFYHDRLDSIGKPNVNLDSLIWLYEDKEPTYGGGIYTIINDTLIIDRYSNPYRSRWDLDVYKYEIIDKNTLRRIEWHIFPGHDKKKMNDIYRFVPAAPLPSPFESSSKSQKWMWYDKKEWEEYRLELQKYLETKPQNHRETESFDGSFYMPMN